MATSRADVILPTEHLTRIAIGLEDMKRFGELFWSEKVYSFHVKGKRVEGPNVVFDVRSMRVNEFVDILDGNQIKWSQVKPKQGAKT